MKDTFRIYLLMFSTLVTGVTPIIAFLAESPSPGIISGVSAATFLALGKILDKVLLEAGASKKVKTVSKLVKTGSVFSILVAGVSAGTVSSVMPVELSSVFLILLATGVAFRLQASSILRKGYDFRLGENFWVGGASLTFILLHFNQYFLFYGYILIALLVLYDLIYLVNSLEERY